MKVLLTLSFFCLSTYACVSSQGSESRDEANPSSDWVSPQLQLKMDRLNDLSSPNFAAYAFTFTNKSSTWLRIREVQLKFEGERREVLNSGELKAYLEAINLRNLLEGYERSRVLGSVLVAGMMDVQDQKLSLAANEYPNQYLFHSFSIPPGLSLSRFLVLSQSEKKNSSFQLEILFEDQSKLRIPIEIKEKALH